MGNISIDVPTQILLVDEHGANLEFHTLVGDGTYVTQDGRETCHLLYGHIEQQVAGLLIIAIEGHRQTIVEETCAQTDVIRGRLLPFQIRVRLVIDNITGGLLVVDNNGLGNNVGSKLVITNLLITHRTNRSTQLDEIDFLAKMQPFLTVDVPGSTQ